MIILFHLRLFLTPSSFDGTLSGMLNVGEHRKDDVEEGSQAQKYLKIKVKSDIKNRSY